MGDFSICNPSTWSLGNIAETATETLTGSEFLGDVVGAGVSFFTGDMISGFDNVVDGLENVVDFITDPRIADAASDAFGTGSTPSPTSCTPPPTGCAPPAQTEAPATTQAPTGSEIAAGGYNSGDTSISSGGGSLEDRIFALLMKLLEKKEGDVEDRLEDAEKGSGGESEKTDMHKLQKANSELSALNQLTTNILQSFNDSRMAVIRNIR